MSEQELLAEMLDKSRDLTKYYLSLLKSVNPIEKHIVNNHSLNSIYWIVAHLIWAEDELINQCTGHESVLPAFIERYHLGATSDLHEENPDFKALLALMNEVHEKCKQTILNMSTETFYAPNPKGEKFGQDDSNKMLIMHAIRHESVHTGNLALIAKINNIKTI